MEFSLSKNLIDKVYGFFQSIHSFHESSNLEKRFVLNSSVHFKILGAVTDDFILVLETSLTSKSTSIFKVFNGSKRLVD